MNNDQQQHRRAVRSARRRCCHAAAVLFIAVGCNTTSAQVLQWQEIRRVEAAQLSAVAFDPIRGLVLRHGGLNASSVPLRDTWDWNGRTWTLRSGIGPGSSYGASMCFDTDRGVGVLFGGTGTFGVSSQTWEWTGNAWTQRVVPGPNARSGAAMVYDSRRRVAVLFGGHTGLNNLNDTWEWNGTDWTQRLVDGPSPRSWHAMAFDSSRGVAVLFGGSTNVSQKNDETWEWDGASWTQRDAGGPAPRFAAAMCFDDARQRVQLSGGRLELGSSSELWEWDGATWALRPAANARPLSNHSLVFDPLQQSLVAVGHSSEIDPIAFDGSSWTPPSPAAAPNAPLLCLVENRALRTLIAIGPPQTPDGLQAWSWNGSAWRRHDGPAPPQRTAFAAAFDERRGVLVLHGGRDAAGSPLGETWEWNGAAWSKRDIPGPSPRAQHAVAFDERRGVLVLFGGNNGAIDLNDLWEYNGSAWTQRPSPEAPTKRARHAMAYDAARGVVVLTGGVEQSIFNDRGIPVLLGPDWWEWDGTRWTNRASTTAPEGRADHQLVQDRTGHRLLMFGGQTEGGATQELWQLQHNVWTRITIAGPALAPSSLGRVAMDHSLRRLVLSSAGASLRSLTFTACLADLAADGNVDDVDFSLFVSSYDFVLCSNPAMLPTCPGDLNGDRLVDDADFLAFVAAYDRVECP